MKRYTFVQDGKTAEDLAGVDHAGSHLKEHVLALGSGGGMEGFGRVDLAHLFASIQARAGRFQPSDAALGSGVEVEPDQKRRAE